MRGIRLSTVYKKKSSDSRSHHYLLRVLTNDVPNSVSDALVKVAKEVSRVSCDEDDHDYLSNGLAMNFDVNDFNSAEAKPVARFSGSNFGSTLQAELSYANVNMTYTPAHDVNFVGSVYSFLLKSDKKLDKNNKQRLEGLVDDVFFGLQSGGVYLGERK